MLVHGGCFCDLSLCSVRWFSGEDACGDWNLLVLGEHHVFRWSVHSSRAERYVAWPPIIFGISPLVLLVNSSPDRLATWKSGSKWMVWNGGTLAAFVGTTVLLMVYLVIRENLRVFRWRNGPKTTIASEETLRTEAKVRMSIRGWLWILLVSVFLSIATALISPYLWQTVPAEKETSYEEPKPPVDCDNYSGCVPPPECEKNKIFWKTKRTSRTHVNKQIQRRFSMS